jgi:hypothetical protein
VAYWERHADIPTDRIRVPSAVKKIEEAYNARAVCLFLASLAPELSLCVRDSFGIGTRARAVR